MIPKNYTQEAARFTIDNISDLPIALVMELNLATEKALHRRFVAELKRHSKISDAVDDFISIFEKPSL